MSGITISGRAAIDALLGALAEQLDAAGEAFDLVVIGGTGLLALDLVERVTRDVDVVAFLSDGELEPSAPLPGGLRTAGGRVARDFGLGEDWLNSGPSDLLRLGLPDGFADRLQTHRYGPALTVHFASRLDQIHLKLYAAVDEGGPAKHSQDLKALEPTRDELIAAARWSRTHDPSPAYLDSLTAALAYFGVSDADLGG